jgi:hypothetical protein
MGGTGEKLLACQVHWRSGREDVVELHLDLAARFIEASYACSVYDKRSVDDELGLLRRSRPIPVQ